MRITRERDNINDGDPPKRGILRWFRDREKRKGHENTAENTAEMGPSPYTDPYDSDGEQRLALASSDMMKRLWDAEKGEWAKEWSGDARDYIENELFPAVGKTEGAEQSPDGMGTPWSAAAVSNLAKAFDPEFEGSAGHWAFINRAFDGEGNYRPEKLATDTEYKVGDIVFKGRKKGPRTYGSAKRRAGRGESYPGHSDIITGTSSGADGVVRYDVQGGNMNDELYMRSYTADELKKRYLGRLTQ